MIEQTSSKRRATVFKIHVLIARPLLDVRSIFARSCKRGITLPASFELYLERLFGVGRKDDDGGHVGEYGAQVAEESAEEWNQLTAGLSECPRHGTAVFPAVGVT